MFSTRKRIFAGKGDLRAEPFCPVLSNKSGYHALGKFANASRPIPSFGGFIQAEPIYRSRRSKA